MDNQTHMWRNCGRAWGIVFFVVAFGLTGAYLLWRSWLEARLVLDRPSFAGVSTFGLIVIHGIGLLVGLIMGELLFRKKLVARLLSRARYAIGETGWHGDAPLAPFCMMSFYRPWVAGHAWASGALVATAAGLFLLFEIAGGTDLRVSAQTALVRGTFYFTFGLAFAYACLVTGFHLVQFLRWWVTDSRPAAIPLPEPPLGEDFQFGSRLHSEEAQGWQIISNWKRESAVQA